MADNLSNSGLTASSVRTIIDDDIPMTQEQRRNFNNLSDYITAQNPSNEPIINQHTAQALGNINTRGLGIKFIDQFLDKEGNLPTALDLDRQDDLRVEAVSEKSIGTATRDSGIGTPAPSYKTKGTIPPSYTSNPLDRIEEDEEEK